MSGRKPDEVEVVAALGFAGNVSHSLVAHPSGEFVIYPLGSTVVIKNVKTGRQQFLHGHSDNVTSIALSQDGSMIASGEKTHSGFKAKILLWKFNLVRIGDVGSAGQVPRLPDFHSGKVQSLCFSQSGKYLASLGGPDDNKLMVWNVETGKKVDCATAANDAALTVRFFNNCDDKLVTAGYHHLRRWDIDMEAEKLQFTEANLGSLRRVFKCLTVEDSDKSLFAGTTTGDVLEISLDSRVPAFKQAGNELFRNAIRSIAQIMPSNGRSQLILGCGDGSVVQLDTKTLKKMATGKVKGEVTSLAPVRLTRANFVTKMYIGTTESSIYCCTDVMRIAESIQIRSSCHYSGINDVAFLSGLDAIFVTCATNDIRVWDANKQQELLRIQVPNVICESVALPRSGDMIISGWSDGKIRAFKPVSGDLEFVINDAHPEGVTAVGVTNDSKHIISGGKEGAVRFWCMQSKKMEGSLKEHKAAVTSVTVRSDDKECVTSSDDGSCVQWDLLNHRRSQAMFAQTMFKAALYHPDESQILTCGSDRKLTYWDAFDGTAIRILEASKHQINALDVDQEGNSFVSGGDSCLLKFFSYDEGDLLAVGKGHSGPIRAIRISPDQQQVVSVGQEGAIFLWRFNKNATSNTEITEQKEEKK